MVALVPQIFLLSSRPIDPSVEKDDGDGACNFPSASRPENPPELVCWSIDPGQDASLAKSCKPGFPFLVKKDVRSAPEEDEEIDELLDEIGSISLSKSRLKGELDLKELASEEKTAEDDEFDENDPPLDVLSNWGI